MSYPSYVITMSEHKLILGLILLNLFGFVRGFDFQQESGCENGVCMEISNCQSALRNIRKNRPVLCGFSGSTPLVCCPNAPIVPVAVTTPPTLTTTTTTQTPIIRNTEIVCASLTPSLNVDFPDRQVRPLVPFPVTPAPSNVTVKPLIVNGKNSAPLTRPWMAALVDSGPGTIFSRLFCGGSLISTRHVLTAAHCFIGRTLDPREVDIYMGAVEINSAIRHEVDKITLHPNFLEPVWYNDIAIVRLLKEVTFKPAIQPICLPPPAAQNNKLQSGQVTVSGWGRVKFGGDLSEVLQEVNLQVFDNNRCNNTFVRIRGALRRFPSGIIDNIICAGSDEPKDACGGDSGGPLFIPDRVAKHWTIVGIVSTGFQCANPGIPGIYTRVSEYIDWIAQNSN